ncbi:MAG: hypothetical protein Q8P22_09840 [Chloroflexota bacterium]|nr:hypothetical protein [Chloroflexota bacterium]
MIDLENALTAAQAGRRLTLSGERVRQLMTAGVIAYTSTPLGRLITAEEVERIRAERVIHPPRKTRPEAW